MLIERMKFIFPLVLLITFVGSPMRTQGETPVSLKTEPDSCKEASKELSIKFDGLQRVNASLDSLMGLASTYDLPLQVVFQVDFNRPETIAKRIAELSKNVEIEKIYSPLTSSQTTHCKLATIQKILKDITQEQSKINSKKIEFLNLDASKRAALISEYEAKRKKNSDQFSVDKQISGTREALIQAQRNLEQAEINTSHENVDDLESFLVAQATINKFSVDIEKEHLDFVEALKTKGLSLEKLQGDLATVTKHNSNTLTPDIIGRDYRLVTEIWIVAADRILELFRDITLQSNVEIPELSTFSADENSQAEKIKNYEQLFLSSKERQSSLTKIRSKMLDDLKIQDFKILNDAGSLRAKLLDECDRVECDRPRGLNYENIQILWREIKIVPLKVLAGGLNKWIEVKAKVYSGFDGWLDLIKQMLILLLLAMIPVSLTYLLRWISIQLDIAKKSMLARSMIDYRSRTNFALWIARLNPFLPSVGMILSIGLTRELLGYTDLNNLAGLLFYFQIFYFYRLTKLLLVIGFEVVFATQSALSLKTLKLRIEQTATFLAKVAFIEYALLHITEDSVRRALAYRLFSTMIFWSNIFLVFYESTYWRTEICDSTESRFPKLWARFSRITMSKFGYLILPLLFAVIALHDLWRNISARLLRLDLVKRVLSEVLRKRLEKVEAGPESRVLPPPSYLKEFDYYLSANSKIFVELENSPVEAASTVIQRWFDGYISDDLVILVGNRGMGKTTSISHIFENIKASRPAKLASVPAKTTTAFAFYEWLSKVLGHSISSVVEFQKFDHELEGKVVFCVDDIQNLFLGSIGGFEAYRLFLEIISLKTEKIFWCLTVNSRSWSYLKGVFGAEHFYGKPITLSPWRDFEIQKLILNRHTQTSFKRSFDESIKAYGAGDSLGQQAEAQFFRLLWGQSRGNPRSALMYWVSALRLQASDEIHVGVPSFVSSTAVATMSDEALFVLSSIARHESLTHDELRNVTRIEMTVIRKCLKEAVDKELVWIDSTNRARISSRAQYVIDYFLIGKNFLYE
jgi:hypothetical protein